MSTFDVAVKGQEYGEGVVRVEGVSHITIHNDSYTGKPVDISFYSKKKGKVPPELEGPREGYKILLAVPWGELSYYRRVKDRG